MNWLDRIELAKKYGFTQDDIDDAEDWDACAVGEIFRDISQNTQILDEELRQLGSDFLIAIQDDNTTLAKELYHKTEEKIHSQTRGS